MNACAIIRGQVTVVVIFLNNNLIFSCFSVPDLAFVHEVLIMLQKGLHFGMLTLRAK